MVDVDFFDVVLVLIFVVIVVVGVIIIFIVLMCSVVRGNKDKLENGWFFICVFIDSLVFISYCIIFKEYNVIINDKVIFVRY